MIKFEKLSADAVSLTKKHLIQTAVLGAILVVLLIGSRLISMHTSVLNQSLQNLQTTTAKIQEAKQATETYHQTLQGMSLRQSDITTKEDLVIALGDCAKNAGCEITAFSSNMTSVDRSITRYNFVFEVKGSMKQVSRVLSNIDKKELHYSVNEISLRQTADYIWLQRDLDNTISWFNPNSLLSSGGKGTTTEITADDILSDSDMKFYINLDFIIITEVL